MPTDVPITTENGISLVATTLTRSFRGETDFSNSHGSLRVPEEVVEGHSCTELGKALKQASSILKVLHYEEMLSQFEQYAGTAQNPPLKKINRAIKIYESLSSSQKLHISDEYKGRINWLRDLRVPTYREQTAPSQRDKNEGYIYLAEAVSKYKIGRSKEPADRINHFDTQMPVDVEELHRFKADDYVAAEDQLHEWAKKQRVTGEWFDLSEEAVAIIQDIAEYRDGEFIGVHNGEPVNTALNRSLA